MRKLLFLFSFTIFMHISAQQKPRLIVGIVVDQMRQEYLHRFYDKFSEGGFKRLMNHGYQFKNAHCNYIPTYTGPGHASIYTGTTPSNHGIIANEWYSRISGLGMYCVTDVNESAVGGSKQNGKISPKNLITSTITDELRISSNFRSKVIGISIKDRSAVLPAGHSPTGAFWFDSNTGNFMSSTYYFEQLPKWAVEFNEQKLVSKYLKNSWITLLPIESYVESTADNVLYERIPNGKEMPTFPYDLSALVKVNGMSLIRTTPYGNTLLLDMGLAAIEGEDLGTGNFTDFLAISFSSTDYVGHAFGPQSVELEDTFLRLDLDIKRLLEYLDYKYSDNYLVFLTSDHGVANIPMFQQDHKLTGGYYSNDKAEQVLSQQLRDELGDEEWVSDIANYQIFLNQTLIHERDLDLEGIRKKIATVLERMDHVEQAYSASEISQRNGTELYRQLLENGYHNGRSGDILLKIKPGYLSDSQGKAGTTHGSGSTYDTHIPILFYGQGIPSGKSVRKVSITDIAPTLSMLLNIPLPNSATGKPLIEIFE